jgi:hypothetical protein
VDNLNYIYIKFFNLGVFSRILLIIVKPLALWLSIQLDADAGLAIAQIYLIGLLFVSLSGTNAHRPFYQKYFGSEEQLFSIDVSRSYIDYIQKITLQLIFVIITSSLIATIVFWGSLGIVMLGLLYGIAEKLNDEFQRYAQFSNNSKSLFYLALSKLIPVLLAATLSYAAILDIRFVFPVLLLVGSILIGWPTYYSAIRYFIKTVRKSFFAVIKMSFNFIRQDILQITCVFMGMSLLSFDKWLLQYFSASDLPTYMLFTQIASIFIVTQTIVLIAPVRARLVNENPQEIRAIKIGSPIISLMSLLLGIAIYFQNDPADGFEHIGFFAFFFSAIVTFTVAYTERLYWVATAGVRLALDATIVAAFVFSVLVLKMFWPSSYLIVLSLGILFCLMCIRVLVMMYLINKISAYNN